MSLGLASGVLTKPLFWLSAGVLAYSFLAPLAEHEFVLCGFRRFTGLPCAGCGMTRSVIALSSADPASAWNLHPFGLLVYPALWTFAAAALVPPFRRRFELWIARYDRPLSRLLWTGVAAIFAFGITRWVFGDWWTV